MNETKFIKEENIGNIGILKVSERLQKLIDYLHLKVGATEWSGILFYKLTKGNIDTLKDLEFTADFLYPMNIGSSIYTEFDYTEEIVKAYDIHEEGIEESTGLIHSHHSMGTFFSGTDSSELRDNAAKYNYYISLIVNFAHEYCAKIAIPTETEVVSKSWFKNTIGKLVPISRQAKESVILIGDLKVVIDSNVSAPEWLEKRIQDLKVVKQVVVNSNPAFNTRSFMEFGRGGYLEDDLSFTSFTKTSKKEPTPLEFLNAAISLDVDNKDSLLVIFKDLKTLQEEDLEGFEVALETNLEIIHDTLYGSNDKFREHCLAALTVLLTNSKTYSNIPAFDVIDSILGEYATL